MVDIPYRGRVKGKAPISLQRLDYAEHHTFHRKVLAVTCLSFFTASYHLFSMSIIKVMVSASIYYDSVSPDVPPQYGYMPNMPSLALSAATLVGMMVGQLIFGWLGDVYGRRRVLSWCLWFVAAAVILTVCTSIQLAQPTEGPIKFMINMIFWRFFMGIGVGGLYPLSAVLISEYAPKAYRGAFIAAVFSMQGLGTLAACLMGMMATSLYRQRIANECHVSIPCAPLDGTWMVVMGAGLAPTLVALYLNRKVLESPRYTVHVLGHIDLARRHVKLLMEKDVDVFEMSRELQRVVRPGFDWRGMWAWCRKPANAKVLLGTALAWFLIDAAFYSNNLTLPTVMSDLGYWATVTIRHGAGYRIADRCFRFSVGYAVVTCVGFLPGYFFSIAMADITGRKPIQYLGFAAMAVALLVFSTAYDALRNSQLGYLMLYSVLWFFANFGPNSTVFIIPAECFPARYRCTLFAVAASTGKAGAITGVFGLGSLYDSQGIAAVLGVLCGLMVLGLLATLLTPKTCGESLEELNERNDDNDQQVGRMRTSDSMAYISRRATTVDPHNVPGSGMSLMSPQISGTNGTNGSYIKH